MLRIHRPGHRASEPWQRANRAGWTRQPDEPNGVPVQTDNPLEGEDVYIPRINYYAYIYNICGIWWRVKILLEDMVDVYSQGVELDAVERNHAGYQAKRVDIS